MENTKEDVPMENSIKIVLTGDMSVGKTCISERFVREKYIDQGTTTGVSYFQKRIKFNNILYHLDIWDTAGQEKYRSLGRMFYRKAYIIIFVYDITNYDSFINLKTIWYDEILKNAEKNIVLGVIGNKSDLFENEKVKEEEARKWAEEIGAVFGIVSAKTGSCINNVFESLVKKYLNGEFRNIKDNWENIDNKDDDDNNKDKDSILIKKKDKENKNGERGCC